MSHKSRSQRWIFYSSSALNGKTLGPDAGDLELRRSPASTSYMTLDKLYDLSWPWFPHLQNEKGWSLSALTFCDYR